MIDMRTRKVIEFQSDEIEELQRRIARDLGYELLGHRLELYGVPLAPTTAPAPKKSKNGRS
jgi:Fur family ferric uptake transcriptional regulator